jgi:hypothetical protein
MEMAEEEGAMESTSRTTGDSGISGRGPQLLTPTYVNATPSGEIQLRVAGHPGAATNTFTSDRDPGMSSGQQHATEPRLLHANQAHGVYPATGNEQVTSAEIRGMSDVPSRLSRPRVAEHYGMEGPVRSLNCPERTSSDYHGSRYRKPATYDGRSDWQDYFVQFEMVAELNNWGEKTKALELATNLRGVALGILSDLRPEHRMSYRHLISALQARFEPTNQSELYRTQIKNRIRKKDEALTELAQDVKRLVRLAYPDAPSAVREQLARDCFIDALNDSELEWAVFQGKAYTVEEAVRVGLEYEAFQAGHKRRTAVKSSVRMQDVRDAGSRGADCESPDMLAEMMCRLAKIETDTQRTSENRPAPNGQRPGSCHYCHMRGHWKFECPNRQNGTRYGEYQNRTPSRAYPSTSQTNRTVSGN